MSEHIKVERSEGVLTLIMARPEKKNALTDAMYATLADALATSNKDPETRVVLIRGEGDMFTAGNDLGEFAARSTGGDANGEDGPRSASRFVKAVSTAAKPIVAAVQGRAVGVGTTMLLHCDQVILAENALLTTPFVGLGLVPEAASSLLLPARIGHARAFSMFALGEAVGAQDALAWGLANKVVAADQLVTVATDVARRLARQPLGAVMATKRLMRDAAAIAAQMEAEGGIFAARLQSPEAKEAFAAFAERRTPDFTRFG